MISYNYKRLEKYSIKDVYIICRHIDKSMKIS